MATTSEHRSRLIEGALASDIKIDTLTRPEVTDDSDHDKFAHFVRKNDITESAITGKAVRAICGKKWVPTRKPDEFPVCPDCKRIYDQLKPSGR